MSASVGNEFQSMIRFGPGQPQMSSIFFVDLAMRSSSSLRRESFDANARLTTVIPAITTAKMVRMPIMVGATAHPAQQYSVANRRREVAGQRAAAGEHDVERSVDLH